MSDVLVRFKLLGERKDASIELGPRKQYKFVDGICEFTCPEEDASKHAHTLEKFYGAKRVKPKGGAKEEVLPNEDDVGEDKSAKKGSKSK